jgi:hypothetical protein
MPPTRYEPIDNALYRAGEAAYKQHIKDVDVHPGSCDRFWGLPDSTREMWVAYVWTEELDRESYLTCLTTKKVCDRVVVLGALAQLVERVLCKH